MATLDDVVLCARLWVEAYLHRAGRAVPRVTGAPLSRYAVSAAEVVKLLVDQQRPDDAELVERAERLWAGIAESGPLAELRDNFELDDCDTRIVAALVAPEHDPDLERIYAYAWDDFARRSPDVGFLADLVGSTAALRAQVIRALHAAAPLVRSGAVLVGTAADRDLTPFRRRAVRLSDRLIAHLHGRMDLDPALDGIASLGPAASPVDLILPEATIAMARRALVERDRARLLLTGRSGTGKAMLVRVLATEADVPLLEIDLPALLARSDFDDAALRVVREATLRSAVVLLRGGDALTDHGAQVAERLLALVRRLPGPVVITARERLRWLLSALSDLVEVEVAPPTLRARIELWSSALGAHDDVDVVDTVEVARRFALSGAAIRRAADHAVAQARLRTPEAPQVTLDDLAASARAMLQHQLGSVARRIEPAFAWSDLVLPNDTMAVIRELLGFVKHRSTLLEEWGFDRMLPYGRGVSAALAGPPGTGKTMVAQLIARELGYDLYAIELAQVVNKYVGETEKNLGRVFDEAERSHAILFFDEADALFAKRTDVKTSNDRYANLEVNYLLQRMESYDGITLLATNREMGLDEAFKRRLRFIIQFELPEPHVRARLWESMFPPGMRLGGNIDWKRLGSRFEMGGGYIKKAALRAASRALARGEDAAITMEDLEAAAQLEYREMGRVS